MGADPRPGTGTRRAVAAGLTASALTWPILARSQSPSGPAAPPAIIPPAPPPNAVLAAATDPFQRMTVPVMINGQGPFAFVVDTGSNRTVVSDALAADLQLPPGRSVQLYSATGVGGAATVRVASLSVGARRIGAFDAPVLTQDNLGALGMLGIDAVANQRIVMDFRRQEMSIGDSALRKDASEVVVRARSKYGQLLLVDSEVDGIPLYVIVDTGGEITIGNATLRRLLEARRASRTDLGLITSVTGEDVNADLTLMPPIKIGTITVNNLRIAYAEMYSFKQFGLQAKPAMLLGMSTLRCFNRVSIDFPGREVRFVL